MTKSKLKENKCVCVPESAGISRDTQCVRQCFNRSFLAARGPDSCYTLITVQMQKDIQIYRYKRILKVDGRCFHGTLSITCSESRTKDQFLPSQRTSFFLPNGLEHEERNRWTPCRYNFFPLGPLSSGECSLLIFLPIGWRFT